LGFDSISALVQCREKAFATGDNKKSIKIKTDYIKKQRLGGICSGNLPVMHQRWIIRALLNFNKKALS
jgi:GH18 family chitinase